MLGVILIAFWLSAFFMVTQSQSVQQLTTKLEIQHINGIESGIDVVLLSNLELDSEHSLASILQFMSWVRKIHVQCDSMQRDAKNCIDHQRIVEFKHDILHYTITSPHLAEHFILFQPGFLVTDYVFPSQFFINGHPVLRKPVVGVTALTRTIFNENAFYEHKTCPVLFALRLGLKHRTIRYASATCRSLTNQVCCFHHQEAVTVSCVVCIVDNYTQVISDNRYWVVIHKKRPAFSRARLALIKNVLANSGKIVELDYQPNMEKLAVAVVRALHPRKPASVRSALNSFTSIVANKVALVYNVGFVAGLN
jgi:hypothetical protein